MTIEAVTRQGELGLHLHVAVRGTSAVTRMRRLHVSQGGSVRIEDPPVVRSVPLQAVVPELLWCLPSLSDPDLWDRHEYQLPWEGAVAASADPESHRARYAQELLGWDELPDVIASAADSVRCEATVTTRGCSSLTVRRWISGGGPWLALGLVGNSLILAPQAYRDIAQVLTRDLVDVVVRQDGR